MPGSIRLINVNGLSAIVDINTTGTPTEFTAYSDLACTQSVALPATITTDTTFYVKATGVVMLSVTVDGTELAGPARVTLSNAGPATFSLDTDPSNDKSGTLLGLVSTHSSGGSSASGISENDTPITLSGGADVLTGFPDPSVPGVTIVGGELSFAVDTAPYLLDIMITLQSQSDAAGEALGDTQGPAPWGVNCYGQMPAGSGKNLTLHWADVVLPGSSGVAHIQVSGHAAWNMTQAVVRVTKP